MRNSDDETKHVEGSPNRRSPNGDAVDADIVPMMSTSGLAFADAVLNAEGAKVLGLDEVSPPAAPDPKRWASLGFFLLIAMAIVATGLVVMAAGERKTAVLSALQARLEESVRGRSQVLSKWLGGHIQATRRLTESDIVRLFASEMALQEIGSPLPRSLLDQRPYFQSLMADFAAQNDLRRAAIIDEHGRTLLSSPGPAMEVSNLLDKVNKQPAGWTSIVLPLRSLDAHGDRLVIDVAVPLPKVQAPDRGSSPAAILALTLPANDIINEVLSSSTFATVDETLALIQERDQGLELIRAAEQGLARQAMPLTNDLLPGRDLDFARHSNLGDQRHYASGKPVPGAGWTLVHMVTSDAALAPVGRFILVAAGAALLVALMVSLLFGGLWWRRANAHHHELIALYRSLTERLDRQRRFLSAVTNSMSDWLSVCGKDGTCLFANPSFAIAVGLPAAEIIGRRHHDLLPRKPMTPGEDGFDGLLTSDALSVVTTERKQHVVDISSSPFRDKDGRDIGDVTVMRDQTDLIDQRRRRQQALLETIEAFIYAIERRDPFLLGHTRRVRRYAIAIGRKLGLDNDDLTGLALAASLSQIGKIFIPDAILTKADRHDQQEAEVMRSHINHAIGVLGRIDFGYPVIDILSQMHERLDGSGYPEGRSDDQIDLRGRILGAADVFCARTAPRAYRKRLSAGKALYHLANNARRYDITVIAALAEIVGKEGGLASTDDLDDGLLDSRIWSDLRNVTLPAADAAA